MRRRAGRAELLQSLTPQSRPTDRIPRLPAPSHRHAAPTGPWPFLDLLDDVDQSQLTPSPSPTPNIPSEPNYDPSFAERASQLSGLGGDFALMKSDLNPETFHAPGNLGDHEWNAYPQSHFPNWTPNQQLKSGISKVVHKKANAPTHIHRADVLSSGRFVPRETIDLIPDSDSPEQSEDAFWNTLNKPRQEDVKLRAYFVDNLSGPSLQCLGARFHIEPFFFSSAIQWIPSRHYQPENDDPNGPRGEHVTITLSFIRSIPNPNRTSNSSSDSTYTDSLSTRQEQLAQHAVDTQAPLMIDTSDNLLIFDLMALHLIKVKSRKRQDLSGAASPDNISQAQTRAQESSSTLISLHPPAAHRATPASDLHKRFLSVGRSVYWCGLLASKATASKARKKSSLSPRFGGMFRPSRRRSSGGGASVLSTGQRRRGSRSDSLGLTDGAAPPPHVRRGSSGSIQGPRSGALGGMWLEDVHEEPVEEAVLDEDADEDVELDIPQSRSLASTPRAEQMDSPGMMEEPLPMESPRSNVEQNPMNEVDFEGSDPTLILLSVLWHAFYCWDEALEILGGHIAALESRTLSLSSMTRFLGNDPTASDTTLYHVSQSQQLHTIRAHLLHYASLLADFRKSVGFVESTGLGLGGASLSYVKRTKTDAFGKVPRGGRMRNTRKDTYSKFGRDEDEIGYDFDGDDGDSVFGIAGFTSSVSYNPVFDEEESFWDEKLEENENHRVLRTESKRLTDEIERLERQRSALENRIKNLMDLAFSRVNIEDSRAMQRLTEASLRDSAAMKQISYLTMLFLPASFAASLFGMNVSVIKNGTLGSLPHYFETMIPLSVVSIWILMSLQYHYKSQRRPEGSATEGEMRKRDWAMGMWSGLWWPVKILFDGIQRMRLSHYGFGVGSGGRIKRAVDVARIRSRRQQHARDLDERQAV